MKKIMLIMYTTIILLLISTTSVYATTPTINTSNSAQGYISVKASANIVVQISKDKDKYNYTLTNSEETKLPLQLGNGTYKILVLKKVSNNQYTALATETIDAKIDKNSPFLNSIQLINYNKDMISIVDLTKLVNKSKSESEKVQLLYTYVLDNFSYDYNKSKILANSSNYIPVIDDTYITEKGICYDMSSLFAAVLRYNKIPTKLVMGYTPNVPTYHAWNEVYYDGKWHVVDVTYDVGASKAKTKTSMVKSNTDYSATKTY